MKSPELVTLITAILRKICFQHLHSGAIKPVLLMASTLTDHFFVVEVILKISVLNCAELSSVHFKGKGGNYNKQWVLFFSFVRCCFSSQDFLEISKVTRKL